MSEKIILFEMEKGVDLPELDWTLYDSGRNIYSAPYVIEPRMKKDVATLTDDLDNRFYKTYSLSDLEGSSIDITLRNHTFKVPLLETDTTPELIATRIRAHTFHYNGWRTGMEPVIDPEDPNYEFSAFQTWTTGGTGAIVTFTPLKPATMTCDLGDTTYGSPWWYWSGPLSIDLAAGNIVAGLTNSTKGVVAITKENERFNCRFDIRNFTQDTTMTFNIREVSITVTCLYSWISALIEEDYDLILKEFIIKLAIAMNAQFPVNTYTASNLEDDKIRLTRYGYDVHTGSYSITSSIPASVVLFNEGYNGTEVTGVREVNSLEVESYTTDFRSFFFDRVNDTLYIRLPYGSVPADFTFFSSLKQGYSNFEGWYDPLNVGYDLFYEGRLINIPNISYKKDSTYYSLVSFDGGNIVLNNTDGFFDNLDEEDVYGQICTLRYSDGGDFQTIYTGYFESFQLNGIPGQLICNVYDKRKVFSNKMPNNYFRIEDYPYLNSANDGLPIPIGFGKINKATAICLNETEQVSVDPIVLPDYYTFKICDDTLGPIESVDIVFFEGVEVTPVNVDLTACTFQLPSTVYVPGKFVSVSYHGLLVNSTLLENPIEVLEFILEKYAGLLKTSFNYNLTEWNAARDKAGIPMIGLHIAENKSMIDIIGEISNSVFGTFLIQKDGLITFKIRDITLDPVATIRVDDQIEAPIQDYKSEEYANSIRVGHSKAWSNGKHSWVTIDDQEQALYDRYRVNAGKEVATLLSSKTDAQAYGDSLYLQYAGIFPTFTIRTKTQFLNLALEDIIDVEVYKLTDGSFGTVRLEVLGVDADLNSNIVTITGRYVSTGGTYTGKKLIKYLSRS